MLFCGNRVCIPRRSLNGESFVMPVLSPERSPGKPLASSPAAEQAEIARLRRQLEVSEGRLERTEAALGIMEKLSAFFENAIKESPDEPKSRKK